MSLIYTGEGRAVVGIPAKNLTDDELAALAQRRNLKAADLRRDLIASGVYAEKVRGKE
jgi:hypothetical protein